MNQKKLYFCTFFDYNYSTYGRVMIDSLRAKCQNFEIFVVCLDKAVYDFLTAKYSSACRLINIEDVESEFPELLLCKNNRSRAEYYFTLSPFIPLYLIKHFPSIDLITSMDADLFFFRDPRVILNTLGKNSIGISGHNFRKELRALEKYGRFNVSFQSFRNDDMGLTCLNLWKKQCTDWCYDRLEGHRFADQKYLDTWPGDYHDILEYKNGYAPWNITNNIALNGEGHVIVDGKPLVYYHFQGLKIYEKFKFSLGLTDYLVFSRSNIISVIYLPYLRKIAPYFSLKSETSVRKGNRIGNTNFFADIYVLSSGKLLGVVNLRFLKLFLLYFKVLFGGLFKKN